MTTEEHLDRIELEAQAWPCRCPDPVCRRCRALESLTALRATIAEMERKQEALHAEALSALSDKATALVQLRYREFNYGALRDAEAQIAQLTAERDLARSDKREGWTAFKRMTERREVQQRERIRILEEALRPFARYIEARLAVFSQESRIAYPELLVSGRSGEPTADIRAEDWERARAALSPATLRTPEEGKC